MREEKQKKSEKTCSFINILKGNTWALIQKRKYPKALGKAIGLAFKISLNSNSKL